MWVAISKEGVLLSALENQDSFLGYKSFLRRLQWTLILDYPKDIRHASEDANYITGEEFT